MTWALKRQLFYIGVLIIFLVGLGFLIVSPYFSKAPTCTDNLQNGDETGVDCGGLCVRACFAEVDKISVLWTRTFEVIPGRYNAVAYLENNNKNTAVDKISYRFRFADKNNIYIGKRDGETFIPPSGKFAIFEPGIGVGNSVPVYVTFEFTQIPTWNKVAKEKIDQLKVLVSDVDLENQSSSPILSANIKNDSLFVIPELSVIAILYDEKGNAVSASRTYIDELKKEESQIINFTWPKPIVGNIFTKEIIPMYNVFLVKLE